jgi:dUTP pyrophosphatase
MPSVEVKFIKTHKDAKLPTRNHGNRELNEYEKRLIEVENNRLLQEKPDMYAQGARVGYPMEHDKEGRITDFVVGTGDTGYDVYSVEDILIWPKSSGTVDTGIELAYISPGYWFSVAPRSGLGFRHSIQPHLGTIDNCYRGDLRIKLYNFSGETYTVSKGERIAQIIFYPVVEANINWAEEKIETKRNESGFGSSGK